MAPFVIESVPARLAGNTYNLDEEESHIKVNQELARATGAGALLERICPAKVYSVEADGAVGVEYAACLECGTCLAMSGDEVGERREALTRHSRQTMWQGPPTSALSGNAACTVQQGKSREDPN